MESPCSATRGELFPQTATWRLAANTTAPSPRYGAAMSYDFNRQKVFLHGGQDVTSQFGDTWEWDGADWVNWGAIQPGPGVRVGAAMAYDPLRRLTLLHGGDTNDRAVWSWDAAMLQWSVLDPGASTDAEAPRSFAGAAFDPFAGAFVRAGGRDADGFPAGGILEWSTVSSLHRNAVRITPRHHASARSPADRQLGKS